MAGRLEQLLRMPKAAAALREERRHHILLEAANAKLECELRTCLSSQR